MRRTNVNRTDETPCTEQLHWTGDLREQLRQGNVVMDITTVVNGRTTSYIVTRDDRPGTHEGVGYRLTQTDRDGQPTGKSYWVRAGKSPTCTCPDFVERRSVHGQLCKHARCLGRLLRKHLGESQPATSQQTANPAAVATPTATLADGQEGTQQPAGSVPAVKVGQESVLPSTKLLAPIFWVPLGRKGVYNRMLTASDYVDPADFN